MFEIGDKVKWTVGQSSIVCRGLVYDIERESTVVICTQNGDRPWRARLTLKTNILSNDN